MKEKKQVALPLSEKRSLSLEFLHFSALSLGSLGRCEKID
jgi:hypothetical protein